MAKTTLVASAQLMNQLQFPFDVFITSLHIVRTFKGVRLISLLLSVP